MTDNKLVDINTKLSGQYKFLIEKENGEIEESGWMDNIILNSGLDQLGNLADPSVRSVSVMGALQIGTGTLPTVETQTRLQTYLVGTYGYITSVSNAGRPTFAVSQTLNFTFDQGAIAANITEVGVGYSPEINSNLFSRALIVDDAGLPTALTVVATDRLTVYYKLTVLTPITDVSGSFIINNTNYNYVSRIYSVYSGLRSTSSFYPNQFSLLSGGRLFSEQTTSLALIDDYLQGASVGGAVVTNDPYVIGSYRSTGSLKFSPSIGNFRVKALTCNFGFPTQFLFTPSIPKTGANQLILNLSFSWGRA